MNLSQSSKVVRHNGPVAVGTTTVTPSAGVDTAGFHGCLFVVQLGAITDGTPNISVQQSDDDGVADAYSDLEGSDQAFADTDDSAYRQVDVYRPTKRFLKCLITRGGATGCVVEGIVAILYEPHAQPAALHSSVKGNELLVSPAEGTP